MLKHIKEIIFNHNEPNTPLLSLFSCFYAYLKIGLTRKKGRARNKEKSPPPIIFENKK